MQRRQPIKCNKRLKYTYSPARIPLVIDSLANSTMSVET